MSTYDERYPSEIELAERLKLDLKQVRIKRLGAGRLYAITSATTYAKEAIAREQAQILWNSSTIASPAIARDLASAFFGVEEVETSYLDILGGIGDWPSEPYDRKTHLADQAFKLTIIHSLDVQSFRALHSHAFARLSEKEVLKIMHERRASHHAISPEAREESRRWLAEHK